MTDSGRPDGWFDGPGAPPPRGGPVEESARVANRLAAPTTRTTRAGLPRREPRAHLVPGSFTAGESTSDTPAVPARSPDEVRSRLDRHQRGVRKGRRDD